MMVSLHRLFGMLRNPRPYRIASGSRGTCAESEDTTPKAKIQHQIRLLFQRHFHQILPITLNPVSLQTKHLTVPASEHLAFRFVMRVSGSLCFLQYMIMPLIESPSYFIIVSSKS